GHGACGARRGSWSPGCCSPGAPAGSPGDGGARRRASTGCGSTPRRTPPPTPRSWCAAACWSRTAPRASTELPPTVGCWRWTPCWSRSRRRRSRTPDLRQHTQRWCPPSWGRSRCGRGTPSPSCPPRRGGAYPDGDPLDPATGLAAPDGTVIVLLSTASDEPDVIDGGGVLRLVTPYQGVVTPDEDGALPATWPSP